MDCILAVQLLDASKKAINKENMIALYEAIKASYVTEEIELLINSLGDRPIEDLVEEGKKKMSSVSIAAHSSTGPVEDAKKEEEIKKEVESEQEDDDYDMFAEF